MAKSNAVVTKKQPKKNASGNRKKPKKVPQHPKVSEMVDAAISTLRERGGSSTHAIKKYIDFHYKVNIDKISPFIKKYLRTSVASGAMTQTKGRGASGSFKLKPHITEMSSKPKSKVKKNAKPVPAKKPMKPKTPKIAASTEKHTAVKSESSEKAQAIKPGALEFENEARIKNIGGIMRVDGSRAPSMHQSSKNAKAIKSEVSESENDARKRKIGGIMRVGCTKAPSMYH